MTLYSSCEPITLSFRFPVVDGLQGSKELIKDLVLKLRGDALGTAFLGGLFLVEFSG